MSLHHLSSSGTTCVVFEGGDIVTIQENQSIDSDAHIEIVGTIDAGIAAARWSPDEELLVVVTKTDTVMFMGATFDPVTEITLSVEDLKASKQVSVGWGKKETQFEGRGAKALRDPTIPEKVDEGVLSPHDDGGTTMSWRGDGAFVAINAIEGARRVIRVYSREGELDSASEAVDGLESALSWRPAGNLIAGIQRRSDRIDVVFFERNGLRHGEFTLRSPRGPVTDHDKIELEWNSDSTALAVVLKNTIQLWTMGNYHWYLKQEIPVELAFRCLAWHPEKSLRFAAASMDSVVLAENVFYTTRGYCRPPHDVGAVAVIDGETVKLTPFRMANVPPPMSLYELKAEAVVIDVAFGHRNETIAVLHHQGIDVYEWPVKNGRPAQPRLSAKVSFETTKDWESQIPTRIYYTSAGQMRFMAYNDDVGIQQFTLSWADEGVAGIRALDEPPIPIMAMSTYDDELVTESYGQDTSGTLYKLLDSGNEPVLIQFPTQLPWFEISKHEDIENAFGLSRNGHLYANSRLLTKNCTSFIVTPSHLIFTTSNHFVKFVHLNPDIDGMAL